MTKSSALARIGTFLAGVVVGVAVTFGGYLWVHRDTIIFVAKDEVRAEGLTIPKGAELVHDAEWSEGFDTLVIYVAVSGPELEKHFTKRVDDRSFLVHPRWIVE